MIVSIELQKALYSSLSESYSVFEIVPKSENFPFITFGDITREENFTKTDKNRFKFSVTIHGWSKGTSSIQSKIIEEYIFKKVSNLDIKEFSIEISNLELSTTVREDDVDGSNIFQTIQEFSFIINEKRR